MIDWSWVRDGFIFLGKTFVALTLLSTIGVVVTSIWSRLTVPKHPMEKHTFYIEGVYSGTIWTTSVVSNSRPMSEEEALKAFDALYDEEGIVMASSTEGEDDDDDE